MEKIKWINCDKVKKITEEKRKKFLVSLNNLSFAK